MEIHPTYSTAQSPKEQTDKTDPLEDQKLRKACADFEAVLLNYMFQSMKKTVPGETLFGGGLQKDIYESMYFQEISVKIARDKGMGIGEALYRQLQHKGAPGQNGAKQSPETDE